MLHSSAWTTRVTPCGTRSISSTSTGRPLIKLGRELVIPSAGPESESLIALGFAMARPALSGWSGCAESCSSSSGLGCGVSTACAGSPIAAAALALARARLIEPSNAALASRSSSREVAEVTAAVPTHSFPTNMATL